MLFVLKRKGSVFLHMNKNMYKFIVITNKNDFEHQMELDAGWLVVGIKADCLTRDLVRQVGL